MRAHAITHRSRVHIAHLATLALVLALAVPAIAQQEPPPPAWSFHPAPGAHGFVVAVESAASEVAVVQCRAGHCWTLEAGLVDYWYPGDALVVLETERDAVGVAWERRTPIGAPSFVVVLPLQTAAP